MGCRHADHPHRERQVGRLFVLLAQVQVKQGNGEYHEEAQAQAQEGTENFKLGRIKPSSDGLADCKVTTRDVNMVIGLYSPFKYGIPEYEGYDITKFRNHIRFMEVIEDRDYGANGNICPLYFDGAISFFSELPKSDDKVRIKKVYNFIENNKNKKPSVLMLMVSKIKEIFK